MKPEVVKVEGFEISRHAIRFIESELKLHPGRKRRLANLMELGDETDDDIIHATPAAEPGMPRSPGVGNPTQARALALIERRKRFRERIGLTMQVRAVEEVYQALPPEFRKVIDVLYFDGRYTQEGAADQLKIDAKTLRQRVYRLMIPFIQTLMGDHYVQYVGD